MSRSSSHGLIAKIDRGDAAEAASHLHAALNGMSVGLPIFNAKLEIIFADDRLTSRLEMSLTVVARAASLVDLAAGARLWCQAEALRDIDSPSAPALEFDACLVCLDANRLRKVIE